MTDSVPIACTLTAAELQDRGAAWRKLFSSGLVERSQIPGGIQLTAAPRAAAALIELIDLERDCCAWIHYDVTEAPGGEATATLTAPEDGEAVLAEMFRPSAD
jgi:hypothetical protein